LICAVDAGSDEERRSQLENYYRGTIAKLHRNPERGVLRTASGREVPFTFAHVTMVGDRRRFAHLHEGLVVGYDVSWTSKGLRVSRIRIPD
jgi:hypothetical protein